MPENTVQNNLFRAKGMRFPKSEKLCNDQIISRLFQHRQSEFAYPFKLVYFKDENLDVAPPKVLISVPKKSFKKAIDRNRIKRQIREIYRQNRKEIFREKTFIPHYLGIIFVAKKMENFDFMEKRLVQVLQKISQKSTVLSVQNLESPQIL